MNHPKSMFQLSGVHYIGFRVLGFLGAVPSLGCRVIQETAEAQDLGSQGPKP